MAQRRFRRASFRRQSGARPTWGTIRTGTTVADGTFEAMQLVTAVDWQGSAGFRRATLLRSLGGFSLVPTQNVTAQANYIVWYLGLFNQDETVPTPDASSSFDEENILASGALAAGAGAGYEGKLVNVTFDTSVKRRLDTNSVLVLCVAAGGIGEDGGDWNLQSLTRFLVRGT